MNPIIDGASFIKYAQMICAGMVVNMAKFKTAAIFSNHMVLQRDKNIKIFGQGEDGDIITVHFRDKEYTDRVNQERWVVTIPAQEVGTGYEMIITCKEEVLKFQDIAIGEVWLAGGQSNMEWELINCKGGEEMLHNDINPKVRFYHTPKYAYMDDHFYEKEETSEWKEFSEESARNWSAVGYIFGKKLASDLDVTVGIIGCNWGGTSASCWVSENSLGKDQDLNTYLEEYNKEIEGKTEEEQINEYKEYEAYAAIWDEKCRQLYKENHQITWEEVLKECGECKYPGPKGCINPLRPSGLYYCMLERIMPYTLKGFLYYQGESDDYKPQMYQKLLTTLINEWREGWEDHLLPFLFVQLPMHRNQADPDYKNWCLIREAQMRTYQTVKNTGLAVILDCGEFNEIHPKNKLPVGERLELQALYHVYGKLKEEEAFGPIYKDYQYKDDGIELSFSYAKEGFTVKGEAGGFEIAGEDMEFVDAQIEIRGQKIHLYSRELKHPRYARYCWTNYGDVTIFGKNGLPLAPFRTHRF